MDRQTEKQWSDAGTKQLQKEGEDGGTAKGAILDVATGTRARVPANRSPIS